MKVCHTLIFFCFLSLQDGNTGVISAEIPILTGKKGGHITFGCQFYIPGGRKIFCKEKCEGKDILIETEEDRAQNGRYSIEYRSSGRFLNFLYVSVTNLTQSDSGRYRCGLKRFPHPDSMKDFELSVEDASTLTTTTTTKESLTSSPGSLTPLSSSPETTNKSEQHQTTKAEGSGQTHTGVQLYVRLTLVIFIIVSSAAVLIFCRKKIRKPKESAVETEYVNVTEANRVTEDRQSRSAAVEISTVHTSAKYTKRHAAKTSSD